MIKIKFNADHVDFGKKTVDKTRSVTFKVAEYELDNLVPLFLLSNRDVNMTITVEAKEE